MKITEENRKFTVTSEDGQVTEVDGKVITTEDGVDEDGNPKISIEIKVPEMTLGATPGEVK